jgi:hypothetical protein
LLRCPDFVMMRSDLAQALAMLPKFACASFDCYYKLKKQKEWKRNKAKTGDWEMVPELCES